MKRARVLSFFLSLCVPLSWGYLTGWIPSSRGSTTLHMGLGSFVKKRLLGQGGENENNDKSDDSMSSNNQSAGPEQSPAPPQQMTRDDATSSARPPMQAKGVVSSAPRVPYPAVETAQDRINRVKQGKMTEEEKQKFLASTLKNVASVNPVPKAGNLNPVRQPLLEDSALIKRGSRSSATPFPKDSMLREVVTGRRDQKSVDEWTSSNKKKKEYFDMVTNPNRFNTFNTQGSVVPAPPPPPMPPTPLATPDYSYNSENSPSLIPWETTIPSSSGSTTTAPVPMPPPTFDPNDSNHLGARLEAAAMAEEQRQREARRAVEIQREEEMRRQAEIIRAREEEMAMREAEILRRKEEAMELARQQDARRREEERLRQEQMMKAQEEYWAKKLKAERQRKLEKLSQQDQVVDQPRMGENDSHEEQPWVQNSESEDQNQVPVAYEPANPPPPMPVPAPMPPPPVWNSASVATSTRRSFPLQRSTNPFLDEQAAKRAEIERARDEQLAKLKALNSPLPSGRPQGLVPAMAPVRRTPISSLPVSATPGMKRTTQYSAPPSPPMRGLNELQRLVNQNSATNEFQPPPRSSGYPDSLGPPPHVDEPAAAKPAGGNGFMGRIFGGNDEQMRNEPEPEPQRKVVRQPLPAVDEDEEFEAFSRNGPNKNMSIKDALQNSNDGGGRSSKDDQENKSKMWGVDMSRFND